MSENRVLQVGPLKPSLAAYLAEHHSAAVLADPARPDDLTDEARRATVAVTSGRYGLRHAADLGERVHVLAAGVGVGRAEVDGSVARLRAGAPAVEVESTWFEGTGALGDALIDWSYEDGTALVVLGVRRRSPVGKALLGSLAQRVILEAGCPVAAVKSPAGARD